MTKEELQKEFEATGYVSWINSDLYPDGKIHTKEYTEWLEKKVSQLTAENQRLKEALKSIEKVAINSTEMEYEDDLDYIADVAIQTLSYNSNPPYPAPTYEP